jgi:hypothetical protein
MGTETKWPDKPYDDAICFIAGVKDTGANVPVVTQYGTTGIWLPLFDVGDVLPFSLQLPHKYWEGTNALVHVHFICDATDAAKKVKWQLTYQWVNVFGSFNAAASSSEVIDGYPVADKHELYSFPALNGAGTGLSSGIVGNLTRVTNGGPGYAGNVFFLFLDAHIQQDAPGSRQEIVK